MNAIPEKRHVHFNILKDLLFSKMKFGKNKQTNKQILFQVENQNISMPNKKT
jgi:hypothetical protein